MKVVRVAERIIPAHTITKCGDCEHFGRYEAPYRDGNVCTNAFFPNADITHIPEGRIHENCPIAEETK